MCFIKWLPVLVFITNSDNRKYFHLVWYIQQVSYILSRINLSGCFEFWGVPTSQSIETARIEFSGLTAQQIKQILQRIPSTFKATLEIAYKEEGEQ